MKNISLTFVFLLMILFRGPLTLCAQGSDMIVLKKGPETTLKTYVVGTPIHFISSAGLNVKGSIKKINKDSIYINTYEERSVYTSLGGTFWDTISVGLSRYHINEVREIIKPSKGFGFIKNGVLFMFGGTAYAILHTVNSAYLKQPIEGQTLAISGGVALVGYLLNRLHKNTIKLGNRYYLQYIPLK
jgi:hypothetical protein